ncbi:MAG TPA: hypothetical protein VKA68_13370 [bacterium]|nr:hypothetical protein [bacterium]
MPRIISVHEYVLKPQVDEKQFEHAVRGAKDRGLFELPGMETYHFLQGIRGARKHRYTAIWVYESEVAWAEIWGPVGAPVSKEDYPEVWKIWEDEILAPFLTEDPDKISFTSYRELEL